MKDIIEKLGIKPIYRCDTDSVLWHKETQWIVVNIIKLEELEQQRNELLEALIELMRGVEGLPPLTALAGVLTEQWNLCELAITKADPKHRLWEEIKEI